MSIGNCSHYIKYYPEFKRLFGSEKAAIIFDRLEYWFQKYTVGFWKFLEPCTHPLYREGDSWAEEVGFSRKVFRTAFDCIGIHYKSKSDFLAQDDPFQGKLYASYYDRRTNRTYFLRNHEGVKALLKHLWQKTQKAFAKVKESLASKGRSCNSPKGQSFARAYKNNISQNINLTSSQDPPPMPKASSESITREEENRNEEDKKAQEMLNLWNNLTQNQEKPLPYVLNALEKALNKSFDGSLDIWKQYVHQITSSRFLMGETPQAPHFKAKLLWVVKPQTVSQILNAYYTLGDRKDTQPMDSLTAELRTINRDLSLMEEQKKTVKTEVQKMCRRRIREAEEALSDIELQDLEAQFTQYKPAPPPEANEFQRTLYRMERDLFVRTTLQKKLGFPDEEKLCHQKLSESGLDTRLETLKSRQEQVSQRMVEKNNVWRAFCRRQRNGSQEPQPRLYAV